MRIRKILAIAITLLVIAAAAFAAIAWRSEIEPVKTAQDFDPALVKRGAELAAVGNCIACHTVPGAQAFAGGLALPTPFGTIYSTNITPDAETGIGAWSEAAFARAMREGVDRRGHHLYPAFPYDHFTRVTDEDNRALYAFLMTRAPVKATPPPNELAFPLGFRPVLALWKLLFLDKGPLELDPQQSEEWNRGAYLAEGLGHCGACTVMVDGRAVRSCTLYAPQVDGCEVVTVEGVGKGVDKTADGLNDLQQAFRRHHALQCGFCTAGILISATQFLAENKNPTEHDVRDMLSGHLCRCTGYAGIVDAILETARSRAKQPEQS